MNICIYGAASNKIDEKYIKDLELLGETLAKEGHSLVFGAGSTGMMGAAARGFSNGNGHILGVTPNFMSSFEPLYDKCTQIIKTETMADRKEIMENNSDLFLIVPGGIGTFDEFFQCLTLKQLKRHNLPIILYNMHDFYSVLDTFILDCIDKNFISEEINDLYIVCNNEEELLKTINEIEKQV